MTKLIIMVGLQASGKSTHAEKIALLEDAFLVESDYLRGLYFHGNQDKVTHQKLFELIHSIVLGAFDKDESVVLDATNLSYKHRMELIKKVKSKYPKVQIVAHVVMTQFDICVERDAKRERTVGEAVIKRAREGFTMPQYYEGIDEIHISYTYEPEKYKIANLVNQMDGFDQKNEHHSKDLLTHCDFVYLKVCEKAPMDEALQQAGLWHDNGKLLTQVFHDSKGNPSEHAHYYGHEHVGAYEIFFYLKEYGYEDDFIIDVCGIIQNHMRLYGVSSEKSHNKLINLIGEDMYERLKILNTADRNSK